MGLFNQNIGEIATNEFESFVYKEKPVYDIFKRAFDIVCSVMALVVLTPLFFVIMVTIMADDFGNPFFVQQRVGKYGKMFWMLKFRSMRKDADRVYLDLLNSSKVESSIKIENDARMTRVGSFIRRTSIDELPQLLNILVGHMSVVEPRPFVPYFQERVGGYQSPRSFVKPGLSCFWQISRNKDRMPFDELLELDLKYIHARSLWTDIKIVIRTILIVFKPGSNE